MTTEALNRPSVPHGHARRDQIELQPQRQRQFPSLPPKLMIGYATTNGISKVVQAVKSGLNIVIWSFVEFRSTTAVDDGRPDMCQDEDNKVDPPQMICYPTFDVELAKQTISQLDEEGFKVIHLVSFGGWNGPHLPTSSFSSHEASAKALYQSWKRTFGDVFDGFDWDLEGNDNIESASNMLTIECLESMGEMSAMAKKDGYIIGMAPAQSYLDNESSNFSRYLNLTDHTRTEWHSDFHYYGANAYAYLLSKYSDAIDFVSIQFYESYSKAGLNCYHRGIPKDVYLEKYVEDIVQKNMDGGMFIDFNQDEALNYASRQVQLPLSKLVFGFANGWGIPGDKVCYFDPSEIEAAYKRLADKKIAPRGFMYWVIDEEGSQDVYFAKSLKNILHTHSDFVPSESSQKTSS